MLGVWNRGTLSRLLQMMLNACRRGNEPLAISVLNVVDMARINDVYGHREGDALLRHVAEVAVYVVRGSDVVARYEDEMLAAAAQGRIVPPSPTTKERAFMRQRHRMLGADEDKWLSWAGAM